MDKTKILVVDDHQMFRAGIANLLNKESEFEIVGEAANGDEAVNMALEFMPDVILMDIELPVLDGFAATEKIREKNPKAKILALTSFESEECIMRILKAGARAYIQKAAQFDELVLAILTVAKGSSYFTKEVSAKLFARLDKMEASPVEAQVQKITISSRELEVVKYVAKEMTNKEIAARLFISPRTVETHRRNIIQKLKVKNTVGLVKYYFDNLHEDETLREKQTENIHSL